MFLLERCNYLCSGSKDAAKEVYFPLAVKTTVVPYLQKYFNRNENLDVCGTAFALHSGLKFMPAVYYLNVFSLGECDRAAASQSNAQEVLRITQLNCVLSCKWERNVTWDSVHCSER